MEDIAQSAGVSAATAYNHFPTKHLLLAQVFAPIVRPLTLAARHDIATGRPVVQALDDQVRALCRLCSRNRTLTAAFSAAVAEYTVRAGGQPEPRDGSDPRTLVLLPEPLAMLVEHGQRAGELRTYPAARDLSGLLVDIVLSRSVNRPDESPEATAELLLTVMFGALRPELLVGAERPFQQAN